MEKMIRIFSVCEKNDETSANIHTQDERRVKIPTC